MQRYRADCLACGCVFWILQWHNRRDSALKIALVEAEKHVIASNIALIQAI